MSGYRDDFSKSNNAAAAESAGRYPASRAARNLNLPVGFIREKCSFANSGEWHHTSKFYNTVDYFDTEEIQHWMNGEEDSTENYGVFETVLAEWKKNQKPVGAVTHSNCSIKWLEWGGTRNHPRAINRAAEGCTIVDEGGKFLKITLKDGSSLKKGKDTRGFSVVSETLNISNL